MRIVVIGGVAAGMSAAMQARRRDPAAEVVVLERGPYTSYSACGMPYNLGAPDRSVEDLVILPLEEARARGVDVRVEVEATEIDLAGQRVQARPLGGAPYWLPWDRLVIATGARALRPPIAGLDRHGVFELRELTDAARIKRFLAEAQPRRAVLVGAGYIGMELAEVLRAAGLWVTVLEREGQVLPGFHPAIVEQARAELHGQGVAVRTGVAVTSIEASAGPDEPDALVVRGQDLEEVADLVVVAVGVRPAVELARAAGIALGPTGAIAVDQGARTSAAGVFAAGDCAEAHHLVSGEPTWIPLGTTANKQGKVAGANAAGAAERFAGIVGSAGFKLFDREVARTGLGDAEVARHGLDAVVAVSQHHSRASTYPGDQPVTTVLWVERQSGRLLGAQMIGAESTAKRIDVLATALHARMSVRDLEALDLTYAPPFAPVYDPILIAAAVARKQQEAARSRR